MVSGLRWLTRCASTNDEAAQRFADPGVRAVAADEQTAGRGRRGRDWISPPGCGLYLSWIVRPRFPAEHAGALPLLAAVATAELCQTLGVHARVKWPNDLLVGERKLAGILCEMRSSAAEWGAVVGIGLNVRVPPGGYPAEVPGVALESLVPGVVGPRALAPRLLAGLERWHETVAFAGLAPVIAAWQAYGPPIGARLRHGATIGTYAGLRADGALLLDTPDGRHEALAGEVDEVR